MSVNLTTLGNIDPENPMNASDTTDSLTNDELPGRAAPPAPEATSARSAGLGAVFWLAFAGILLGEILDLLDTLVTTVAGPPILRDLGGTPAGLQWLSAGYTLALAGGVLIGGRLGDRFGRKRLFLIGMAGFVAASLIAALSPSLDVLLGARCVQGLLGALMLPQSFGLIRDVVPRERLGAAFGAFGVTMALSALAGPLLAGALVSADLFGLGWRAIFAINIPLGIAGLLIGTRFLPASRPDRTLGIDYLGCALGVLAMVCLVFPLVEGPELGWPWWCFALFGAAALAVVIFVVQQRGRSAAGRDPLVLPSLFGKIAFTGGLGISMFFFTAFMASSFVLAVLFQIGLGLTPLFSALAMLPQAVGMIVGLKGSGKLVSGRSRLLAGFAVAGLGQATLAATLLLGGAALQAWWLAPGLLITGIGSGAAMGPIFDVIIGGVDEAETGSASGVLNATQQIGGATGVAVLGTVLFAVSGLAGYAAGAAAAYGVSLVLVLAALALASRILPRDPVGRD